MSQVKFSDKFIEDCSPVIDSTYPTHGTITKSSVDHMTPSDLDTLFTSAALDSGGLFRDLDAWFFHSIEMKACGTRRYAWYDWIMANTDRSAYTEAYRNAVRPGARAAKGPSLLMPFIMGRQEAVINRDYWKIEDGIDAAGYAAGGTGGQAIGNMSDGPLSNKAGATAILRVSNRHGIPIDANWFRPGEVLHVFTIGNGLAEQGNWKVVRAAVNTTLTYIDVAVTSENIAGQSFHDYTQDTSNAAGDDITGVMIPGINNVSDFESWCHDLPNIDPRNMVPFWFQTFRQSRRVDSEYLAVYARLMQSNEAFRQFGDLDMAERNRQDESEAQRRFVNAFFFQKPISTNQTLANWESLEAQQTVSEVYLVPGLSGKIQGRRANFVGVKEQMRTCARIKDLGGNPLNLQEWFQINYEIMRARKSQGRTVTRLDWHTNAWMREWIFRGMLEYYKSVYTDAARYNFELGKTNEIGFIFDVYRVPFPAGLEIAVISDEFMDDWYSEHDALSQGSLGNLLLCLDIGKPGPQGGTIYYAQLAANRKSFRSAAIEELAKFDSTFRCVMETVSEEVTMTSETGTVVLECPANSLWVENIKMALPVSSGKTLPYSDLY